jgi:hypothetical protein
LTGDARSYLTTAAIAEGGGIGDSPLLQFVLFQPVRLHAFADAILGEFIKELTQHADRRSGIKPQMHQA